MIPREFQVVITARNVSFHAMKLSSTLIFALIASLITYSGCASDGDAQRSLSSDPAEEEIVFLEHELQKDPLNNEYLGLRDALRGVNSTHYFFRKGKLVNPDRSCQQTYIREDQRSNMYKFEGGNTPPAETKFFLPYPDIDSESLTFILDVLERKGDLSEDSGPSYVSVAVANGLDLSFKQSWSDYWKMSRGEDAPGLEDLTVRSFEAKIVYDSGVKDVEFYYNTTWGFFIKINPSTKPDYLQCDFGHAVQNLIRQFISNINIDENYSRAIEEHPSDGVFPSDSVSSARIAASRRYDLDVVQFAYTVDDDLLKVRGFALMGNAPNL